MSARAESCMRDFLSLSAEEKSEFLRLLNSPSDEDPWPAPPPAPGLPASANTPGTAAVPSTSTDPSLPPTPLAIPAPSPQTPAPLHAAPESDASTIPMAGVKHPVPEPTESATVEVIEEEGASAAKKAKGSELKRKREPDEPQEQRTKKPGGSIGGEGGSPDRIVTQQTQQSMETQQQPMEHANSPNRQSKKMELSWLEEDLGVKHSSPEKKFDLPQDKWMVVTQTDADGTTLLMKAAAEGALECVELLLRCGADVNALRKYGRKRAVDFSLDGGHSAVSLLLFKWDSCFSLEEDEEKMKKLLKDGDKIEELFQSRDEFHKKVRSGFVEDIKKNLPKSEYTLCGGNVKYWVNSEGDSALYTAAREEKFDAWAYLKSKNFEYVEKEKGVMKETEKESKKRFDRAMYKYFVPVHKFHVYKMIKKTKLFGCHGDSSLKVHAFYDDIDRDPMTSQLLQCLQDEPHFEVVVDMRRSDISCVYAGASSDVRGITDEDLNRVYASAGEKEQSFTRRDVVSNIAHELAHKVMHVVFNNKGLPYRQGDEVNGRLYRGIVKRIMCSLSSSFKKFDEIIRGVANYDKELHDMEMIVRVPEMVSKYYLEGKEKKGYQRLEYEAEELLQFYKNHVMLEIEKHIEKNQFKNKMPAGDFLDLICGTKSTDIEVDNMEEPVPYEHNGVRYLSVSNLKLGISHLIRLPKNLVCVDWTNFVKCERYFQKQMSKRIIEELAIVWDKGMGEAFCEYSPYCESRCPASNLEGVPKKRVTLVIPKEFQLHDGEVKTLEYKWENLSSKTKKWLLEKKVSFQGSKVTLERLLEGVVGKGDVEGWMERNVTPGEISMLIDEEIVSIGRAVATPSNDREKALILGDHKECLIPRRLRLRPVKFDRETFYSWKSDAFFIFGAEESDLIETGITEVHELLSGRIPGNARCFVLPQYCLNSRTQKDIFRRITGELKYMPYPSISVGTWKSSHFFSYEGKSFQHLYSQSVGTSRTLILADDPGNGKSLYVKAKAQHDKSTNPLKWIKVVELSLHEEEIKSWKEVNEKNAENERNLISREEIENSLSNLINVRETEKPNLVEYGFETKIFKLSCQQSGKIIVIFDGLDEVCPDHREKVLYFLKSLIENTQIDVIVTTRKHECAGLEKSLGSIAYNLEPYDPREQLRFLEMEWKSVLKSLPDKARDEKIQSIITNLRSSHEVERKKEISDLIEKLKNVLNKNFNIADDTFKSVAERLMDIGKASVEGESNFTATPLNAWMAAEVFLEENFNFSRLFTLEKIYEMFIDKRISHLYLTEYIGTIKKTKAKEGREIIKSNIYSSLKELSASFFLREANSRVKDKDILIRAGLVVERDGLNVFVHRTIGEYMLSIWIIDGKADVETMIKVLLGNEFHQVRRFLEGQLPSIEKQGSSESGESVGEKRRSLMNLTMFPSKKDAIISFKKCLYLSIAEGNIGIMKNLIESSGKYVESVVYKKAGFDITELNLRVDDSCDTTAWNAFNLFGQFILGNLMIGYERTTINSRIQSLRVLLNFLEWIKGKDNFIGPLVGVLADQKLLWMGFGGEDLWKEEGGKKQFELLLQFLIGLKGSLYEEYVKKALMDEESKSLFNNAAEHSIKSFVPLLDAYLKESDFDDLLLPSSQNTSLIKCNNVVCAWTTVARRSGVEGLQLFWNCLRSKMETPEKMKRFLRRKDGKKWNALFASFCNEKSPQVFAYVRELYVEVSDGSELKDHLFNTFSGVESTYDFNKVLFFDWIIGIWKSGSLNEDEVGRLLLSENKVGIYYLLDFAGSSDHFLPPFLFSKVQRFIFERLLSKKEIMRNKWTHYGALTEACFYSSWRMGEDVEFKSEVESAFERMRPSIFSFPPFRDFQLDRDGKVVGAVDDNTEMGVKVIQFKAFTVLLRRQVEMEEGMLGREEAVKRLKAEWEEMFYNFHRQRIEGREERRKTSELFVRFTFAVLSEKLTKEEIAEILLRSKDFYNPFHYALDSSDPMGFLAMYDIARWCMAEDALWRVHAVDWRVHAVEWREKTVLEYLLRSQEERLFEYFQENRLSEYTSSEASTSSRKVLHF